MTDSFERSLILHEQLSGKIGVMNKVPIRCEEDLSVAYTPGVARPCQVIAEDPSRAFDLTIKGNSVAIVSDGSAVLGLGNIGPLAAIPVMEGKALLFKEFAAIVGTGRSDFPNQVNNVLAFPGIFRGALDGRAKQITPSMKLAAAHALARVIEAPTREKILPPALDRTVAPRVAAAVREAAG